jgi:hypothetical protein
MRISASALPRVGHGRKRAARPLRRVGQTALPEVGGALVGGASLKAADFEAIFRTVTAKA